MTLPETNYKVRSTKRAAKKSAGTKKPGAKKKAAAKRKPRASDMKVVSETLGDPIVDTVNKGDPMEPVFTRKAFVKEYHETEQTEQLSGCRLVMVSNCGIAEMPLCAEKTTTQRVRYGRLVVTFPVVDDDNKPDVDRIVLQGRLTLRKVYPTKQAEAGHWVLDMKVSDSIADTILQRLIWLKRDDVEIETSFFGTFEQKTIEGMVDAPEIP